MRLAALLDALASSPGSVTETDLARRLGTSRGEVTAMLDALRAGGRLGPNAQEPGSDDACASSGSCAISCPGPSDCPLIIDLSVAGLEIRGRSVA